MSTSLPHRRIAVVSEPLSVEAVTAEVTVPQSGAVLVFLGTVRELTAGRRTVALDYEAYPEMAVAKMNEIVDEAIEKWPVQAIVVLHRTGHLQLTEASVVVALSCPHRKDAYAASQYVIDELKARVPVWKKENWDDGTTEWVHPEN